MLHEEKWKLSDFGIARDAELGTQDPTFLGAGSYEYMAPETWTGQSPTVKTDLYSLGVLFFELLAGSRPFPGPEEEDYARQHQLEQPPDPATDDPILKRLILRLLMKQPALRPQDAKAVEETLARVGNGSSGSGRLAELALKHAEEISREEAEQSAEHAREVRWYQLGRQATEDMHDLHDAARTFAREIEANKARGAYLDPARGRITVAKAWERFRDGPLRSYKETTQASHTFHFETYVLPRLGSRRLSNVDKEVIERLIRDLEDRALNDPRRLKAGGYRTREKTLKALQRFFSEMVSNGRVAKNPALGVRPGTRPLQPVGEDEGGAGLGR